MIRAAMSHREMPRLLLTATLSLAVLLSIGCGDSGNNADDASNSTSGQQDTKQENPLTGSLRKSQDQARDLSARVAERSEQALESFSTDVRDAVEEAEEQGSELTQETKDKLVKQAEEIYEQAKSFIKNNRTELAEQAAQQLQSMKAQLPASWQEKIDQLQSEIDEMVGSDGDQG